MSEHRRMSEWWSGPQGFLWLALATGAGASVAFGSLGTIIVAKRLAYLAGAVAHASIGGIGLCLYLAQARGWSWVDPLWGGALLAALGGIGMELVRRWAPDREDTLLSALWAVGMSVGLICLSLTPGYANPTDYLFGNLLLVSPADLGRVLVLDLIVLGVLVAWFPVWQAASFDEEFARLRGLRVEFFSMLFIVLVSLTVVLLLAVVGLILVVALMTLPAAAAGRFTRSLGAMMAGAIAFCLVAVLGGIGLSYMGDWPTGPSIVLLAAALYLAASALGSRHRATKKPPVAGG
ncbi:MAG: metal ABC transporter permease [Opitutales bacterium]